MSQIQFPRHQDRCPYNPIILYINQSQTNHFRQPNYLQLQGRTVEELVYTVTLTINNEEPLLLHGLPPCFPLFPCQHKWGSHSIPCSTVELKAAPCVTYASGKALELSAACCVGLQQLTPIVKSVDDKKAGVKSFTGVHNRFLSRFQQLATSKLASLCPLASIVKRE